jgi:hypothetical protein
MDCWEAYGKHDVPFCRPHADPAGAISK